jgi:hypothetical protein
VSSVKPTTSGSAVFTLDGVGRGLAEDAVMRRVIRQMHDCAEGLITIGAAYELDLPVTGLYVLTVAEQVACLALEALRLWPGVSGAEPQAER